MTRRAATWSAIRHGWADARLRRLLLVPAVCTGALAASCEAGSTSCTETATCAPILRDTDGGDATTIDAETYDEGSAIDGDAVVDTRKPIDDVSVDNPIDVNDRVDATDEARRDNVVIDAFDVTDVGAEPAVCDPGTSKSPAESTCLINEKYGVFVSPQGSDTTGIGTRGAPYKTLVRAMQGAKGSVMRVYACDDGTGYTEALNVEPTFDGMSLYGGFECAGWTYASTRRAKVHPATGIALNVKELTVGVTVEDFEFDAADAAMGQSSIGGIVDTALNVVLRGVKVVAGKGGGGATGVDGAKGPDAPAVGPLQAGVAAMCPGATSPQNGGAWSAQSLCFSLGGNGGAATQSNDGTLGTPGNPRTNVTPPNVDNGGGKGLAGQDGNAGSVGDPGAGGAMSSAAGTFTATGYTSAPPAGDGAAGNVGQGGGGGGASNAPASSNCIGASGGAGGMGGCGGSPGTGGGSSGASVALLAWMSPIMLDRCDISSGEGGAGGNGGNGGKGGIGKPGASGGAAFGDAGTGLGKGGNGGPGGNGGNGGSGAGGNGGPSYAIVFNGTAPTRLNGTVVVHGTGGAKGIGGSVDLTKAPDGVVGAESDEFAVP